MTHSVTISGNSWHQSNRGVSQYISIYLGLFVLILLLSKFLHDYPHIGNIIPEAAMIILVGMLAGLFIFLFGADDTTLQEQSQYEKAVYYDQYGQEIVIENGNENTDSLAESLLSFSPTLFFVVLLPPIIYNSGYHIQRDLFFRHLSSISMYAFLGTTICTVVVASLLMSFQWIYGMQCTFLELLTFGALISATDPVSTLAVFSSKKVDPHLFYLVFGESILNDAVGLVLFDAFAHLLENQLDAHKEGNTIDVGVEVKQFFFDFVFAFVGSLVLGISFGLIMARFMKMVDFRKTPILELSLATTFMYMPFVVAELFHLSGIVTVLFAGISCRRYVEPNLSDTTKVNADWVYRLTAHVTETFIFLELGLSVWSLLGSAFSFGFFLAAFIACLIGRACNIYPLTLLYNLSKWRRVKNDQKEDAVAEAEQTGYVEATEDNIDRQYDSDDSFDAPALEPPLQPSISFEDDRTIPLRTAHMMWFSGLRGAVSYGLVRTFPDTENKATIIVTTMMLILLTTFLLGGSTEMVLNLLEIPTGIDENKYLQTIEKRNLLPGFLLRFEHDKLFAWAVRGDPKNTNIKKTDAEEDADDPELNSYENIEVVQDEERSHNVSIMLTNRNGKIFDYGA
ncbi:CPA1 family sodium/proton antiporter [Nitzschia inconspicua]|uniref:CPA1 family sodium/proton antiporter n=1 Tax=Nitzschia inconspicua TaxID=303405 RepID=A0A9K3LCJ6_9STRA|nr:CPA1 family sodium/proton antiporter [Nitzschia inconspicua]